MLSSAPIPAGGAAGKAAYYGDLAREDYYVNGGEPPGKWVGKYAEQIGVTGAVTKEELVAALRGFDPKTGEALAANAGDKHHAGYDLTFSAPKSVSVIWAAADPEMRKAISEAQQRAVESAISHVERSGALTTSRGHAWQHRVAHTGGVVAATYEHSTSREGDPQLHTHAIVCNVSDDGRRVDFNTSAKHAIGAAYRVALASEMQKIGFTVERDKTSFRVAGVDKALETDLSKRRAQIVAELKNKGMSGGKAAAIATLATREKKGEVDRERMFAQAQIVAKEHGLDAREVDRLSSQTFSAVYQAKAAAAAAAAAIKERLGIDDKGLSADPAHGATMPTHEEMLARLTQQASTVTEWQMRAAVMQEAQGKMSLEGAEKYLDELKASELTIELRDADGRTHYTSTELAQIERELGERAAAMHAEHTHPVTTEALRGALEARTMSEQQKDALRHLTSPERIAIAEGAAGAGKSYLMDAAREAWERSGYNVVGMALAGKAAEGLQNASGIESRTVAASLLMLDKQNLQMDSKSIVVVDEAGMLGSRQMQALQAHIDRAGAKLVLVGERAQLQPIDAGGALRAQIQALGERSVCTLNEIRRQQSAAERASGELQATGEGAAERAMVMNARSGHYTQVIEHLENNGRLVTTAGGEATAKAMASGVVADLAAGKTSVALVETRAEVERINEIARAGARAAGLLSGADRSYATEAGERQFATGDRLIFRKNDGQLDVKNGTTGTVEHVSADRLSVKLDETGRRVDVDLREYKHVDLAYAYTVHRAQGITVDRAHYAPGGMTARELAYVALSRHRETGANGVRMYVAQGADRAELAKRMGRAEGKALVSDIEKVEKFQTRIDAARAQSSEAQQRIEKIDDKLEKLRWSQTERLAAGPAEDPRTAQQIEKLEDQRTKAVADLERATREVAAAQEKQNEIVAAREFAPEPPKSEFEQARADVMRAEAAIERLERQIEAEKYNALEKEVQRNTDFSTKQEMQNGSEQRAGRDERGAPGNAGAAAGSDRVDRYADLDPERLAAGRSAALRVGDSAEHAPRQPAQSIDALRDVSGIPVVHHAPEQQHAYDEMRVQAAERDHLAARQPAGDELRRAREGGSEANRGARESLAPDPQAAARIERLEGQLAAAVAGREAAVEKYNQVSERAAKAFEQQKRELAESRAEQSKKAEISRLSVVPKLERNIVQRDGELARKALESHRAGDKLPSREKVEQACKQRRTQADERLCRQTLFRQPENRQGFFCRPKQSTVALDDQRELAARGAHVD